MNPVALLRTLATVFTLFVCVSAHGQLVIDDKNLNEDVSVKYIQLMYFIDKGSLRPVFYVDYGFIEPEYEKILEPGKSDLQKITINGQPVTDRVTVVWVLNHMYKAGWEYIGDVVYVPIPMMDKWTVFTLKRK